MIKNYECPSCKGKGYIDIKGKNPVSCPNCQGQGGMALHTDPSSDTPQTAPVTLCNKRIGPLHCELEVGHAGDCQVSFEDHHILAREAAAVIESNPINPQGETVKAAFLLNKDLPAGTKLFYVEIKQAADVPESVPQANPAATITEEQLASLLPYAYYMDLPDGGSVSLFEQLRRMSEDAARYRTVKLLTQNQLKMWRGAFGCSDAALDELRQGSGDDAAPPAESAQPAERNAVLEEAALQCEEIYSWRGAYSAGLMHENVLKACASAIRSLKSQPTAAAADRTFAMLLMDAAAKSGDPNAVQLAAQLGGIAPCDKCGFIKAACRCAATADAQCLTTTHRHGPCKTADAQPVCDSVQVAQGDERAAITVSDEWIRGWNDCVAAQNRPSLPAPYKKEDSAALSRQPSAVASALSDEQIEQVWVAVQKEWADQPEIAVPLAWRFARAILARAALSTEVKERAEPELCEDEGCPHHGTAHVCIDQKIMAWMTKDGNAVWTDEQKRAVTEYGNADFAAQFSEPLQRSSILSAQEIEALTRLKNSAASSIESSDDMPAIGHYALQRLINSIQTIAGFRHPVWDYAAMYEVRDLLITPLQPIVKGADSIVRFKENRIVSRLLEVSRTQHYGLNQIAVDSFTDEERMQFAQLIGYSVDGYCDLSYASEKSKDRAQAASDAFTNTLPKGDAT